MILIAHRGLIDGPDKLIENSPHSIETCWNKNYDVEVDLRYINEKWYLGHDEAQYEIPFSFLDLKKTWIHCKNFQALSFLINNKIDANFFWHQEDYYTLTSKGFIWTYPGYNLDKNCIFVLPELVIELNDLEKINCYGICSDYISKIGEIIK